MDYIIWFLFFVLGFSTAKIFTSFLNIFSVIVFSHKTLDEMLKLVILLEQEILFIREVKIKDFKDSGFTEEMIDRSLVLHDNLFNRWRERLIAKIILNVPNFMKSSLKFGDWKTATEYIEQTLKGKK